MSSSCWCRPPFAWSAVRPAGRSHGRIASTIARRGCFSGRPPVFTAGNSGSIRAHCSSLVSDGYRAGRGVIQSQSIDRRRGHADAPTLRATAVIGVGGSRNYGEHGSYPSDRRWRADLCSSCGRPPCGGCGRRRSDAGGDPGPRGDHRASCGVGHRYGRGRGVRTSPRPGPVEAAGAGDRHLLDDDPIVAAAGRQAAGAGGDAGGHGGHLGLLETRVLPVGGAGGSIRGWSTPRTSSTCPGGQDRPVDRTTGPMRWPGGAGAGRAG